MARAAPILHLDAHERPQAVALRKAGPVTPGLFGVAVMLRNDITALAAPEPEATDADIVAMLGRIAVAAESVAALAKAHRARVIREADL